MSTTGQKDPSTFEDILEIFYSPTAVFERRKDQPAFGLALVIFAVLFIGLFFLLRSAMEPIFDAEIKRGMAAAVKQNPQLTPEMVEKMSGFGRTFAIFGICGYALVGPLVVGLVLWLFGKLVSAKQELGQAMMVTTFAFFPRLVQSLVNGLQALVLPEESLISQYSVSLSPARFLNPDAANPLLLALLGRVDLFTLWMTALMAIGLAITGKVSRGQAALAAAGVWLIGGLPQIWGAVRQMMA
jgi:hypothetical protein